MDTFFFTNLSRSVGDYPVPSDKGEWFANRIRLILNFSFGVWEFKFIETVPPNELQ